MTWSTTATSPTAWSWVRRQAGPDLRAIDPADVAVTNADDDAAASP
jgi:hypothetical protein